MMIPRKFRSLVALPVLVFCFGLPPLAGVDTKTGQRIEQEIEKVKAEVIKIRRFLHMNPELSNREFETSKLVAAKLNALGFEVRTGVAKTGVVGLLRGSQPGPTVAVRADMDALPIQETAGVPFKSLNPGVMHACGHDIHTATVLGTAMVLASLKDRIKGNIKFVFQPAEEGPPQGEDGGAPMMIREGVLDNPAVGAIFSFHVWPDTLGQVFYSPGPIMAGSDVFTIGIKGRNAHGARPQEGIDAIVLAAEVISALQTVISRSLDPTDQAVLTIGKIEGGTRSNIIAEKVTFEGTVRTLSDANRKKIPQLMESIVKGITQSFGASYTFEYKQGNPILENNADLGAVMLPTLVGLLGKDKVHPIIPQFTAEDFSSYTQKIPGFYLMLGVKSPSQPLAPLHSPNFNPDERGISAGIRIMCHLLLDSLEKQLPSETAVPPAPPES